jgi:hypothetical protein
MLFRRSNTHRKASDKHRSWITGKIGSNPPRLSWLYQRWMEIIAEITRCEA